MIFSKESVEAGLAFRTTSLWKIFNDGMLFAVRLNDGEIGYCCVMGQNKEHYSLGLYRGNAGFSSYLTITDSEMPFFSAGEQFEKTTTMRQLSCDFVNASDSELTKEYKAFVKKVSKESGIPLNRQHGYPNFVKINCAKGSIGLQNERDAEDITLALWAGVAVAEKVGGGSLNNLLKNGFDPDAPYPTDLIRRMIPLLTPAGNGTFEWSMIPTPGKETPHYPKVEYKDAAMAEKIAGMKHKILFQARLIHFPTPFGDGVNMAYPEVLLLVNLVTRKIVTVLQQEDPNGEEAGSISLDEFAQTLIKEKVIPISIEVCDDKTEALLSDFCRKTSINLKRVDRMRTFDEVWGEFFMVMKMSNELFR